jgi:methionyl-tRNA formyltransferase
MRIVIMCVYSAGVQCLEELVAQGEDVVGVVSWIGGSYCGRPLPPEVSVVDTAYRLYLPLYQPKPEEIKQPKFVEVLRKLEPDLIISAFWGTIFSPEILSIPPLGCINIHPSRLPEGRGITPNPWPIVRGRDKAWQTLHFLDPGVDTGDVVAQGYADVLPEDTGWTLTLKLGKVARDLLAEALPLIREGKAPRIKQDDSLASRFYVRTWSREINWRATALEVHNMVRAWTPSPTTTGAYTFLNGQQVTMIRSRVVPEEEQLQATGAVPGEILGSCGDGLLVQTGDGQVVIQDLELGPATEVSSEERIASVGLRGRVILGPKHA